MDTLCGVGLPELILLTLLSFVLIGPERSQEVGLKVGRFLRSIVLSPWWREFNEIASAIKNLPTTLMRMSSEIEGFQSELERTTEDINRATRPINIGDKQAPSSNPWGIENAVAQTTITPPDETDENSSSEPDGEA